MIPRRVFFDPEGMGDDRARTQVCGVSTPPPGQWPPPQPPSNPMPGNPPGGPWGPQPQGQQPTGDRRSGNTGKWVLGGLAVLVIIVVTVVATILVVRGGSDSRNPTTATAQQSTTADHSDVASANDRGPAGIILEDPTCARWTPIAAAFGHASSGGWDRRDPAIPATRWTPDQRNQYEAVQVALRDAADRTVELARETPHRVMREIYEQFIAYSREYISRIAAYTEPADLFARVAISAATALNGICGAITYGAAGARAPLVPAASLPVTFSPIGDPGSSATFLNKPNPICRQWLESAERFTADTEAWRSIDPNTPSAELSPAQREIHAMVMPVMESFATQSQLLGRESDNGVWEDLATLGAQYRRAYVSALPTYTVSDNYLQLAAGSAAGTISGACRAVGA